MFTFDSRKRGRISFKCDVSVKYTILQSYIHNQLSLFEQIRSFSLSLSVLYEYGGIVLDFNTTILKPFTDLLSHEFVIGEHGMDFGICSLIKSTVSLYKSVV